MTDLPTPNKLIDHLLIIARDPKLRGQIYDRLGDYCHQCRNRLNSLKLSLYLAIRLSTETSTANIWSDVDRAYQDLERRVNEVQMLCRPMTLTRVTLGLELLIADRREAWSRLMTAQGRTLKIVPPLEHASASFDVERLGQALDMLIAWRAGESCSGDLARLRWWVVAGHAHIVWEESMPRVVGETGEVDDDKSNWALPILARVAIAHGGDYRIQADPPWKIELLWPSTPLHPETPD